MRYKVTFGGWYQRTTLHLSEIFGFLSQGFTKLDLSKERLEEYLKALRIKDVSREVGYLEYVKAINKDGIEVRYYEDGLYILEIETDDIKTAQAKLQNYFDNFLNPSLSYIFSLGAPTPKVLANIPSSHPTVVSAKVDDSDKFKIDAPFGEVYSKITSGGVTVFKTPDYIFIISDSNAPLTELIEMQIFFREFKDQLEKYLNIHRKIWEEIEDIKERRYIKGKEVDEIRIKLDSLEKTINLISSRINQMDNYVGTRASLSKNLKLEDRLINLFQYKFEALTDTHAYIQDIWQMTKDYLSTAIGVIKEIEDKKVASSIRSIQILASIGVVSGILGYLTQDSLPKITQTGLIYFILLMLIVWPLEWIISFVYKNIKYKLNFPQKTKNL